MELYYYICDLLVWYEGIWGLVTVVFWSLTYVFIALSGFLNKKERKVSMPYIAGVLNIGWEVAATIYTGGNPGFIAWFILDMFIFFWGFLFLSSAKKRILYCISILLITGLYIHSFHRYSAGFLFSVYAIDVIMEIEYLFRRRDLSGKFKISIAVTKLLGDLAAGLTFYHMYDFVIVFAMISFICNSIYLVQCIQERRGKTNK